MKTDDRQPASGAEGLHRQVEHLFHRLQFVVHCDPQGLECLGCRVVGTVPALDLLDDSGQLQCACHRPGCDDCVCDPPGGWLLTILVDDFRQIVLRPAVDDLVSAQCCTLVETHVQRGVDQEGKASGGDVKLH